MDEYTVYPILMRRTWRDTSWNNLFVKFMRKESAFDWGIRCIFPDDKPSENPSNTITWLGTGVWEGRPYYHLGTRFKKGYGAVDICGFYQAQNKDKDKEPYCYKVDSDLLKLIPVPSTFPIKPIPSTFPITPNETPKSSGFDIEREWSEKWRN